MSTWKSTSNHWTKNPIYKDLLKKNISFLINNRYDGTGKPRSEETKNRISLSKKGCMSPRKGIVLTDEIKNKISESKLGSVPWNKGKSYEAIKNERNCKWRGDEVGYSGLHSWVKRKLGKPKKCESCGTVVENPHNIHWANKDHSYQRNLLDWLRLCATCHSQHDKKFLLRY